MSWVIVHFLHAEKSFRNLIKPNPNQIVFPIFQLIWNRKRTRPFAIPNQSENSVYNLILVCINKISLCVRTNKKLILGAGYAIFMIACWVGYDTHMIGSLIRCFDIAENERIRTLRSHISTHTWKFLCVNELLDHKSQYF